jgi:hypothetical protein
MTFRACTLEKCLTRSSGNSPAPRPVAGHILGSTDWELGCREIYCDVSNG